MIPTRPSIFHGREQEHLLILSSIKRGLDLKKPARIAIRGSGGLGKTTLALSVLYHEESKTHFADRVHFVSCEATTSSTLLFSAISRTLKFPQDGGDPLVQLKIFLENHTQPTLLILDNFETPWLDGPEGDQEAVRQLLLLLCSSLHVTILVTTRIANLPQGVRWSLPILPELEPISLEAARDTFIEITEGAKDERKGSINLNESTPELDALLQLVDRVPLAVTLMASAAQLGESIPGLRRAWEKERTSMLAAGGASKSTNIEISIKLSIDSKPIRANPISRRLLSLLCLLPDGADRSRLGDMTTISNPDIAIRILKSVSLAYEEHKRIKILSPIRGYVLSSEDLRPHPDDKVTIIECYRALAQIGVHGFNDERYLRAREVLEPEEGNLSSIFTMAISEEPPSSKFARTLGSYMQFLNITCRASELLQHLVKRENWDIHLDAEIKASLLNHLAHAYQHADRYEDALMQAKKTREFAFESNSPFQAAVSLLLIGVMNNRMGNYKESLKAYVAARREFSALNTRDGRFESYECSALLGDVLFWMGKKQKAIDVLVPILIKLKKDFPLNTGLASQILLTLARANVKLGHYDLASSYAEESYSHFKETGYIQGEGCSLWVLGSVLRRTGNHEDAAKLLGEAIQILTLGRASMFVASASEELGEVWGKLKRADKVKDTFNLSLEFYKKKGDLNGQSECLMATGKALANCGDPGAIVCYQNARALFLKLGMECKAARALLEEEHAKETFETVAAS